MTSDLEAAARPEGEVSDAAADEDLPRERAPEVPALGGGAFGVDDDLDGAGTCAPNQLPTAPPRMPTQPVMEGAQGEPAGGGALLKRQLAAARAEVQALLGQVAHINRLRASVLEKDHAIEAMKVWLVNVQSERDQAVDLAAERASAASALAPPEVSPLEVSPPAAGGAAVEHEALAPEPDLALMAELAELRQELASASAERDASRQRMFELETRLEAHATAQAPDAAQMAERLDDLQASVRAARKMSDTAEQKHHELLVRHRELGAENSRLVEDREEASERAERLKIALERLRSAFVRVSEQGQQVPVLEGELAQARARIEALETERDRGAPDREIPAASTEATAAARESLAVAEEALAAEQARAAEAIAEVEALRERVSELEETETLARAHLADVEAELEAQRAGRERVREELEAARDRLDQEAAQVAVGAGAPVDDGTLDALEARVATAERATRAAEGERDAALATLSEAQQQLALAGQAGVEASRQPHEGDAERVRALEQRVEELTVALDDRARAAQRADDLATRYADLQGKTRALAHQLNKIRGTSASPTSADPKELAQLRQLVQRSSAQIQRYLLELEGSKGAIARTQQEVERYGRSVMGLHEGINHLNRYLQEAGPAGQQALVLLQEVRRCASEIRALVESNERFGRAMARTIERLGAILMED